MSQILESRCILVSGGAGYVGSTFIRDALAAGYEVRCLDLLVYGGRALSGFLSHPRFRFVRGDIRDPEAVRRCLEGVDSVVHLAAIVGDLPCQAAPVSAYQINYEGTKLLADHARRSGVSRFVFASTCSNYGIVRPGDVADEGYPFNPVSLYAETKIDAERTLLSLASEEFAPTCLRFGTAYGVSFRTRFDLLVNSFAFQAWTEREIAVFAANTWRPYVHVGDMSQVMLKVLEADPDSVRGEVFNAGDASQNLVKRDVVEVLRSLMPDLKVQYVDTVDDRRDYRVDFRKLEERLGFSACRTVRDGFKELLGCFEHGILTPSDFEANKLETLERFFAAQERELKL